MRSIFCLLFLLLGQLYVWAGEKITIKGSFLNPVITVTLTPQQLGAIRTDVQANAGSILTLKMLMNNIPADVPVTGRYIVKGSTLQFSPLYNLGYDREFEIQYTSGNAILKKRFKTPAAPHAGSISKVEDIYPLADTIPYNTLFFNVRFSEPMMPDQEAYKHISVYDENDTERLQVWRQRSFWLDSGRVLVLMIHPGRVKSGIHYESPLFDSGKHYKITVNKSIRDVNGNPIAASFTKQYYVSGVDKHSPVVKIDRIPAANTSNPLQLLFSEGMDYASVIDGVEVYDSKGIAVPVTIKGNHNDKQYNIIPVHSWRKAAYTIVLKNAVYDFAANRMNRLFEVSDMKELETDNVNMALKFEIQ